MDKNERIERSLRLNVQRGPNMDASEVDELVNAIYNRDEEEQTGMTQPAKQPFLAFAVETLRGAKEEQCREKLCDMSGRYCAVGVLLHRLGTPDTRLHDIQYGTANNQAYYAALTEAFVASGYADVDVEVLGKMTGLNDDDDYTFAEIAAAFTGGPEEGN